jgi:hypothetical protein
LDRVQKRERLSPSSEREGTMTREDRLPPAAAIQRSRALRHQSEALCQWAWAIRCQTRRLRDERAQHRTRCHGSALTLAVHQERGAHGTHGASANSVSAPAIYRGGENPRTADAVSSLALAGTTAARTKQGLANEGGIAPGEAVGLLSCASGRYRALGAMAS